MLILNAEAGAVAGAEAWTEVEVGAESGSGGRGQRAWSEAEETK